MKPDAHLLNLARGRWWTKRHWPRPWEGRLAGAGIDVFTREFVDPYNPRWPRKAILSPRIGDQREQVRMLP